ncbi:MAG: hypothetical protein NVSMB42_15650 [Herpetosiphon sp.]
MRWRGLLLFLVLAMGVVVPAGRTLAAEPCYPGSALPAPCLSGALQQFWERNGGLPVFGFPITLPQPELNADTGRTYTTQWFERNRFEVHPENAPPYDIELGRLGSERLALLGRPLENDPVETGPQRGCIWFAQTAHQVCDQSEGDGFKTYWQTHGLNDPRLSPYDRSLALFGLPLTAPHMETNSSNDTVLTQWFERARFEWHPRNAAPFKVLLGLLGREVHPTKTIVPPRPVRVQSEQVADGFDQPLLVTNAADGSGRIFVVERPGRVKVLPGGNVFLDIADRVGTRESEQGLLGLAFHPRFASNGYLYVNYTDRRGDTVIARFTAGADHLQVDPASEKRILFQPHPAANHNGGMLAFGPDGYLYAAMGDGGGAYDTFHNGQNRSSLLGKLLRIDVDHGDPYAIPSDNPFISNAAARPEIWAYGLRNPWRFSFDRQTGDLYIGDVGQDHYESIHHQPPGSAGGRNYGWPIVEGSHCTMRVPCNTAGLTVPVAQYDHSLGCAVIAGYVYRGSRFPALQGSYLFGDFCSGRIWALQQSLRGWLVVEQPRVGAQISSFGEDENGELYITDIGKGRVFHLTAAAEPPMAATP